MESYVTSLWDYFFQSASSFLTFRQSSLLNVSTRHHCSSVFAVYGDGYETICYMIQNISRDQTGVDLFKCTSDFYLGYEIELMTKPQCVYCHVFVKRRNVWVLRGEDDTKLYICVLGNNNSLFKFSNDSFAVFVFVFLHAVLELDLINPPPGSGCSHTSNVIRLDPSSCPATRDHFQPLLVSTCWAQVDQQALTVTALRWKIKFPKLIVSIFQNKSLENRHVSPVVTSSASKRSKCFQ